LGGMGRVEGKGMMVGRQGGNFRKLERRLEGGRERGWEG
jgi:hypothetical protein